MSQSGTIPPTTATTRRQRLAFVDVASRIVPRGRVLDRDRVGLRFMRDAFIRLLADTMTIRDLYAKHGEQASGPCAKSFTLICERHRVEQVRLIGLLASHVRTLGGEALVMAADIAETTRIPRPPRASESHEVQIERLLNAHEAIARQAVALVNVAADTRMKGFDRGDTALIASELILTGKLQVWLLAEHLKNVTDTSAEVAQTARIVGRFLLPFC